MCVPSVLMDDLTVIFSGFFGVTAISATVIQRGTLREFGHESGQKILLCTEGTPLTGRVFDVVVYVSSPPSRPSKFDRDVGGWREHLQMKTLPGGVYWECFQREPSWGT